MPSREAWAAARHAFETRASTEADVARSLKVTPQAVNKRKKAEGWKTRNDILDDTETQITLAVDGTPKPIGWLERKETEAAGAGLAAAVVRQTIIETVLAPDSPPMKLRALALAYRTFVDAAQLLTGGNTEQHGVEMTLEERSARVIGILSEITSRARAQLETAARDDDAMDVESSEEP